MLVAFVYNGGTIFFFCCVISWYFLIFRMIYFNAWNKIFSIIWMCWIQLSYQFGFCSSGSTLQQIQLVFNGENMIFFYYYKVIGAFLSQEDPLEYMKLFSFTFLFAKSNYQIILAFGWVKFVKPITKSFFYNESLFLGYYKVTTCHLFQMGKFQCLKQFLPTIQVWWIKLLLLAESRFQIDTYSFLHGRKCNHKVKTKYLYFFFHDASM